MAFDVSSPNVDMLLNLIKSKLMSFFPFLEIDRIYLRENYYDDSTFFVDVIIQDVLDKKKAGELAGSVRLIRPYLIEIGELSFPVFSFIARSEAGIQKHAS